MWRQRFCYKTYVSVKPINHVFVIIKDGIELIFPENIQTVVSIILILDLYLIVNINYSL